MLNMKKIVKLTESDLIRIVKRVITETTEGFVKGTKGIETEPFLNVLKKYIEILPDKKVVIDPIINSNPLEVKGKDNKKKVIDVFTFFNKWCLTKDNKIDKDYHNICLDVLYYTKEDQSTIVNLIP